MKQVTARSILMALLILSICTSPLESIFLPVAQAGSSNPGSGIGLVAWTNVGSNIDLTKARVLFKVVNSETTDAIQGTYSVYVDNYDTEDINLYVDNRYWSTWKYS